MYKVKIRKKMDQEYFLCAHKCIKLWISCRSLSGYNGRLAIFDPSKTP